MKIIGYISGLLLAFCGLPEVIHTIQKGNNSSSWGFLSMWFLGEIGLLIYIFPKRDYPLLINYIFNIILISILIYYKI